jgi:hypothetical protein
VQSDGIASTIITSCNSDQFTEGAAILKFCINQTSIHHPCLLPADKEDDVVGITTAVTASSGRSSSGQGYSIRDGGGCGEKNVRSTQCSTTMSVGTTYLCLPELHQITASHQNNKLETRGANANEQF